MIDNQLLNSIAPDEQFTWSAAQLAKELPDFQLKGAGWYCQLGTWMLVSVDAPGIYTLSIFYDRDPRPSFRAIADGTVQLCVDAPKNPALHTGAPTVALMVLLVGGVMMFPLSFWLCHHIGNWSILAMLGVGFLFGQAVKYFASKGK